MNIKFGVQGTHGRVPLSPILVGEPSDAQVWLGTQVWLESQVWLNPLGLILFSLG